MKYEAGYCRWPKHATGEHAVLRTMSL